MVFRIFEMIATVVVSGSFRVNQIRFRPGLRPDPDGELTALPRFSNWFKGSSSKGDRGKERKMRDRPPYANSSIRPSCGNGNETT